MSPTKNPYIVLGIPRDADLTEVKRAYRRLVRAFHPDFRQEQASPQRLIEVQQAYEPLGDPQARHSYDILHPDTGGAQQQGRPRRAACEEVPVEPLVPMRYSQWRHGRRFKPVPFATPWAASLATRSRLCFTLLDETLGGSVPEVLPARAPSVAKDLFVEVVLTHEEARTGGTFPLTIPLQLVCRACLGSGLGSLTLHCRRCEGQGFDVQHREMELVVPAGVAQGQEATLEVQTEGEPLRLRVLVRIA